eukprot:TRINITY_DN13951_c0_g1_i1.p1 TRINITY_DN13951_c0_g1~~TRINITY_DN13951_c0_g1_i1.p1  ORF type:complete len:208 (-),score=26.51 TRINITY_DN13951_c0_g1_i1:358-981(-)
MRQAVTTSDKNWDEEDGPTATYHYRIALVAVWPRAHGLRMAAATGLGSTMRYMEQWLAAHGCDMAEPGIGFAGVVPDAERATWSSYLREGLEQQGTLSAAVATRLVRLSTELRDLDLLRAVVLHLASASPGPRVVWTARPRSDAAAVVAALMGAVAVAGWDALEANLMHLLGDFTASDTVVAFGLLDAVRTRCGGGGGGVGVSRPER